MLEFHWVAAQPKINAHNPAGPAATQPYYLSDETVQLIESNVFSDTDIYYSRIRTPEGVFPLLIEHSGTDGGATSSVQRGLAADVYRRLLVGKYPSTLL